MQTGVKIAIGLGAAILIGGGIYLVVRASKKEDEPSNTSAVQTNPCVGLTGRDLRKCNRSNRERKTDWGSVLTGLGDLGKTAITLKDGIDNNK